MEALTVFKRQTPSPFINNHDSHFDSICISVSKDNGVVLLVFHNNDPIGLILKYWCLWSFQEWP